jgi:cytochrome d ubiquinol oxidase subunit I
MIDGKAHVTSWIAVIFNPSFPYRFTHMLIASGLTVSFLLAGLSAYRWLKGDKGKSVQASLRTGVYAAAFLIPLQIAVGDQHGLNTLQYQPAKIAAMEAIWETQKGAPAVLFAVPDKDTQTNRFEIAIPKLASLYLTHAWDGEIKGIKDFGEQHPPVAPVFWGFRIMVGVGLLMLAVSWLGSWQLRKNALQPWMARVLVGMTFAGWVALIAGWYTTEIGRQPWLVQDVLTAAQAASKVHASNIAFTLAMYLSTYAMLLSAYVSVVFHLARKAAKTETSPSPDAKPDAKPDAVTKLGVAHA